MNDTLDFTHPARSPEFLSRLRDGELADGEARAFAEHRAACDECREAADAYAATLAAFRSSPTAPPAADLSARILRKIRQQSPSRRPFGVTFGIDVRWAGALLAALLVVLISAPLVMRHGALAPANAPRPPIAARILEGAESKQAAAPTEAEPAPQPAVAAAQRVEPAAPPPSSKDQAPSARAATSDNRVAAAPAPAPPAPRAMAAEPPADEEKTRLALAPRSDRAAAAKRSSADASGGEAAAPRLAETVEAAPRFFLQPIDGEGLPPGIASRPPNDRLAALKGREFVVLVDTGGRVRRVLTPAGVAAPDGAPLQELRFVAGDRPRRLLVRIE
ncbi:MAG TPA: hypothetical protein VMH79_04000 [Thermoanaerobaculia bacterium]|nr:hypothetical protein [Thermoanaerobaculia bacterium]